MLNPEDQNLPMDNDALDVALMSLLDQNLISMSWCDEKEEFVFFLTDEQKAKLDQDIG
ncbi:MAG: hypothetical protein QF732_09115 [Nitrospinaceae bacterium]|jgi:hypothetical protein|nr:hypothetical protein [Nitrospinaceae bacterium]